MSHSQTPSPFRSSRAQALNGSPVIPGDKSISHRSLMFGGIAKGRTEITGLLDGEDVMRTADALRAMGAHIEKTTRGTWICEGAPHLSSPDKVLDMGNSGTSTRLLMGLIGGYNIRAALTGDASLTKRPMGRVIDPLRQMNVDFETPDGDKLPLTIIGSDETKAMTYDLPVASAQVKSCVLLCGLNARGTTTVIERVPTRDHTENMLRHFGVTLDIETAEDGAEHISIEGGQILKSANVKVPRDPSSAAFPAVSALITPGSDIRLYDILMNDRRAGLYRVLKEMGADITFEKERIEGGEKTADLHVRHSDLRGIDVPPEIVPSMIDEFPVLAVAASFARGTTRMTGLAELRVKESDRLLMMYEGLKACGVNIEMGEDWLTIHGNGEPPAGGARVETALDHRIAMSFLVLGCAAQEPVEIDDNAPIRTSFPNFIDLMNGLGARIGAA